MDFIERLKDEFTQLGGRLDKLQLFFGMETFRKLPKKEQELLEHQFDAMERYYFILQERLRIYEGVE